MCLINHPILLELIKLKAEKYGKKFSKLDILLHTLFTLLWTSCASIRVNEFAEPTHNPPSNITRITVVGLAIAAQVLTFVYMYKVCCSLYFIWTRYVVLYILSGQGMLFFIFYLDKYVVLYILSGQRCCSLYFIWTRYVVLYILSGQRCCSLYIWSL